MDALFESIVRGGATMPLSLAPLPSAAATSLLRRCVSRLPDSMPVSPPIEVLRLFYGCHLDALQLHGLTDDVASECFGGGLRSVETLHLRSARITAFGCGHLWTSLQDHLIGLEVSHCPSLGAAGVAQLCVCKRLRRLRLIECALALGPAGVAPLCALPEISVLDLGGNPIEALAATHLCDALGGDGGERELRELRLYGTYADDTTALALMSITSLRSLDVGWARLTCEGLQAIALGLGSQLMSLDVGHVARLEAGSAAACLGATPHLAHLSLAGLPLSADDLVAALRLPSLTSLDLHASRLEGGTARREDALEHIGRASKLRVLRLDLMAGGALSAVPPIEAVGSSLEASLLGTGAAGEGGTAAATAVKPPRLEELRANECFFLRSPEDALRALPWMASSMPSLQRLQMAGCRGLRSVFERLCHTDTTPPTPSLVQLDAAATDAGDAFLRRVGEWGARRVARPRATHA